MEKLPMYAVSGYIPSDEDKVSMNVYILCELGQSGKDMKYFWKDITNTGGIGTARKFEEIFVEDIETAILKIFSFLEPDRYVARTSFTEMLENYNIIKLKLENKLAYELSIGKTN